MPDPASAADTSVRPGPASRPRLDGSKPASASSTVTSQARAESDALAWSDRLADLLEDALRLTPRHAEHARMLPTDRRRALIAAMDRFEPSWTAARAALVLAEKESGDWRSAGYRSAEDWRAATSRKGRPGASAEVRLAQDLSRFPAVARSLDAGQITVDHADRISRATRSGNTAVRRRALAEGLEERLVRSARGEDAARFARTVDREMARVDAGGLQEQYRAQHAARYLRCRKRPDGTLAGEFLLDMDASQTFGTALDAHTAPPAAGDLRSRDQRMADALEAMADLTLSVNLTKPGALLAPQVNIVMREDTLAAVHAAGHRVPGAAAQPALFTDEPTAPEPERPGPGGEPTTGEVTRTEPTRTEPTSAEPTDDEPTGDESTRTDPTSEEPLGFDPREPTTLVGCRYTLGTPAAWGQVPPATYLDGSVVPPSVLEAILCRCTAARVVVDAQGIPVDLGRSVRLYDDAIRRAVIVRDGGTCAYPGCSMPAAWADVHHIRAWCGGGITSVANGVTLCRFHHVTMVHARGVRITPIPGGLRFTRPDGRVIGETLHVHRAQASSRTPAPEAQGAAGADPAAQWPGTRGAREAPAGPTGSPPADQPAISSRSTGSDGSTGLDASDGSAHSTDSPTVTQPPEPSLLDLLH